MAPSLGHGGHVETTIVQDLEWLLALVGLVAATLAYARLCDRA